MPGTEPGSPAQPTIRMDYRDLDVFLLGWSQGYEAGKEEGVLDTVRKVSELIRHRSAHTAGRMPGQSLRPNPSNTAP